MKRKTEDLGQGSYFFLDTRDYVEVVFHGTCVCMQGNVKSDCGMIDIYIDGELKQNRDLYIEPKWDDHMQCIAAWLTSLEALQG